MSPNNPFQPRTGGRPIFDFIVKMCLLSFAVSSLVAHAATIIYVNPANHGSDSNTGASPDAPVATVGRGIALAAASGGEVRVAPGVYDENGLSIPSGVSVSGNWDYQASGAPVQKAQTYAEIAAVKDTRTPGEDPAYKNFGCDTHTCLTNSHGDRVITLPAASATGSQVLSQMRVIGPNLAARDDGSSSFGVVVDGASEPRLDLDLIVAGYGAQGVHGADRMPGEYCTYGGKGAGGGGMSGSGNAFSSSCSDTAPQQGESVVVNGVVVAQGGKGGANRNSDCSSQRAHGPTFDEGGRGQDGQNGVQGKHGSSTPTNQGGFRRSGTTLVWEGSNGGDGVGGSHGAGGGGGGHGESANVLYWCFVSKPVMGGAGHIGSRGGCGGGPGGGGKSGGSAFALLVNKSTVASTGLALMGGQGGGGGSGGVGAVGHPGEKDANPGGRGQATGEQCGVGSLTAGTGGAGGFGGDGGGGGGGAGGNGGGAIALALLGTGQLTVPPSQLHIGGGRSGRGGEGGLGGQDHNKAPSGGNGLQAQNTQFVAP